MCMFGSVWLSWHQNENVAFWPQTRFHSRLCVREPPVQTRAVDPAGGGTLCEALRLHHMIVRLLFLAETVKRENQAPLRFVPRAGGTQSTALRHRWVTQAARQAVNKFVQLEIVAVGRPVNRYVEVEQLGRDPASGRRDEPVVSALLPDARVATSVLTISSESAILSSCARSASTRMVGGKQRRAVRTMS